MINTCEKIKIYYFSGTGNTQIIARKIVEIFKSKGYEAVIESIENVNNVKFSQNEVVGIGFPIAGFTTYPLVFDFINKIGEVSGNKIFAFDTMAGSSLFGIMGKLRAIFINKGFKPIGCCEFRMPVNLLVEMPQKFKENIILNSYRKALEFVNLLILGKSTWIKIPIISEIMAFVSKHIYKITEYRWHQKLLKMRVDYSKCTNCGLCARKCPNRNIEVKNKKVIIGDKCLFCFRCVGICPAKSMYSIISRKMHYIAEGATF